MLFKIHVYDENAKPLFQYESNVIPIKDDTYAQPCGIDGHYTVTKRILHTNLPNVISIWVIKTK
jgi:hypothetical protein